MNVVEMPVRALSPELIARFSAIVGERYAVTDPAEIACVSNPTDTNEKCYACGWKHNDPGNLVSTGKDVGDVIGNMQLIDQCLETVSLWDFAATPDSPMPQPAEYHILFMTAAW